MTHHPAAHAAPDQIDLAPLKLVLERQDGISCAWLFGSAARGEARADSDLDIACLFEADPPHTLAGLHLDLADELSAAASRPVDLVVLNRAPVDLIHRVLRDGILLLDRNPSARIRFVVRTRNEYFDLLPHLLRYRRLRTEPSR